MWTLVYMAADKCMSDSICSILKENEIIFKLKKIKKDDSDDNICYEILVPDAEVEKAQELIFEQEIN